MKIVYVAHQLSVGDREENRRQAAEWCGWISRTFGVAISADWIILTGQWDESMRHAGLATDIAHVIRSDEMWMVGPSITDGMRTEAMVAEGNDKPVLNLTGMSREEIVAQLQPPLAPAQMKTFMEAWGGAALIAAIARVNPGKRG